MLPQPPTLDGVPNVPPTRIKVFGVLHIVFGVLGLVGALLTIPMYLLAGPGIDWFTGFIADQAPPGDPATQSLVVQFEAMKVMFAETALMNWIKAITGAILGVLMLIAGIGLVKRRKGSVAQSNRYAWSSLVFKVVNIVVFLLVGIGAMNRYYAATSAANGTAASSASAGIDMVGLQQVFGTGMTLVGFAIAAIYPILCLVMLNKDLVKGYLSQHGT